ncbi:YktB family protein [Paenibacillus sp. FA6]|uniref:YktB family protein n=1 Tax=Paenibacillus sp. FA6 TaxID=3413029 RepID=UPI003F6552C6
MSFTGFTKQDFDVFHVPGLQQRMEALIANIRPKLDLLGTEIAPFLSALCGEEIYPHVAKHARRKVNPPKDTWVAWGTSKRGYKALPHFQVGMFESHLFIIFAVIYESPNKLQFAKKLQAQTTIINKLVPQQFYWSMDHMDPSGTLHSDVKSADLKAMAHKLSTVKKAEIMCGLRIDNDDPILQNGEELLALIHTTFEQLLPLYKMSF